MVEGVERLVAQDLEVVVLKPVVLVPQPGTMVFPRTFLGDLLFAPPPPLVVYTLSVGEMTVVWLTVIGMIGVDTIILVSVMEKRIW